MFNESIDEAPSSENVEEKVVSAPALSETKSSQASVIKVLILTEGGGSLGWGHLTRCAAITQGLELAGCEWQAVVNTQGSLPSAASGPRWFTGDWRHINEEAARPISLADYVIVDSYLAAEDVYEKIYALNSNLIVIDDNNRINYPPCILINPNIYGDQMTYPDHYQVWAGAKYMLLRESFWDASPKTIGPLQSVLITLGGGNFQPVKKEILKFFVETYPDFKKFVIGCGRERSSDDRKDGDANTVFFRDIDAKRVRDLMISSDVAISAGGQTLGELARMGVPTVAFSLVDNQDRNVDAWASHGFIQKADAQNIEESKNLIKTFVDHLAQDQDGRSQIVSKAQVLVDGQGVKRVVDHLVSRKSFSLRKVREDDCDDLWQWRNDPAVRGVSLNQGEISLESHRQWFDGKLKDSNVTIYVFEDNGAKAGQARFETAADVAFIHMNMNPAYVGRGFGAHAIACATRMILQERPSLSFVKAEVLADNLPSQKAFQKAGYVQQATDNRDGRDLKIFLFRK